VETAKSGTNSKAIHREKLVDDFENLANVLTVGPLISDQRDCRRAPGLRATRLRAARGYRQPMPSIVPSYISKLDRAEHHLLELKQAIGAFGGTGTQFANA